MVLLVLDDLGRRDQDIELVALVAHSEVAFDCHIEAVEAPAAQICHAFLHVAVVVD